MMKLVSLKFLIVFILTISANSHYSKENVNQPMRETLTTLKYNLLQYEKYFFEKENEFFDFFEAKQTDQIYGLYISKNEIKSDEIDFYILKYVKKNSKIFHTNLSLSKLKNSKIYQLVNTTDDLYRILIELLSKNEVAIFNNNNLINLEFPVKLQNSLLSLNFDINLENIKTENTLLPNFLRQINIISKSALNNKIIYEHGIKVSDKASKLMTCFNYTVLTYFIFKIGFFQYGYIWLVSVIVMALYDYLYLNGGGYPLFGIDGIARIIEF